MAEIDKLFDFRPKFSQKGILGSNFIKLVTDSNSAPSNYVRYQVVAEIDKLFDFRPKFSQKGILGSNFIKLVTDSNSAPSNYARYQVVTEIREGPLFLMVQGPTFLRVRVQGPGPVYKVCPTEHAILQLTDDLHKNFNENKFTIGVFIDLSKAFDTVDHKILLEKLNYYGIHGHYHKWFTNYLKNRKQFIEYETGKQTNTLTIKCGVPQGSILGPLLFLLYINDLAQASRILKPITFADDTNLFYAHENINILFQNVNIELQNLCDWFSVNKLSLNNDKTKYTFFHKPSISDYIPLKLPPLYINNKIIKRSEHIRFLGIILDENLTWKKHINTIESKIAKNIGALYRAKFLLNQKCLKNIYFAFIHSYINYGNIAWASTNYTQLRKLHNKQKHASRIIFNQDKNTHARPLMKKLTALNIYQLNIYQTLILMYKSLNNSSPKVFQNKF